jgi:hypothetical protein
MRDCKDSLREMVRKWQLKPATESGIPVQIEALVNFTFETKLINNHPLANTPNPNAPTSTKDVTPTKAARKGPIFVLPRIIQLVKPDCSMNQPCHGIHGDVWVAVNVLADGTIGEVTSGVAIRGYLMLPQEPLSSALFSQERSLETRPA